jgi:hypothetical protein
MEHVALQQKMLQSRESDGIPKNGKVREHNLIIPRFEIPYHCIKIGKWAVSFTFPTFELRLPATMNKETTTTTLDSKRIAPHPRPRPKILLAITGSVAAIKGPELAVRLVREVDAHVRILLTKGGENFWNKAEAYNQMYWTILQDLMKLGSEDEDRGKISMICKFFW